MFADKDLAHVGYQHLLPIEDEQVALVDGCIVLVSQGLPSSRF